MFQAGGKIFKSGPGSLVTVPRHTEHSFLVEEAARLLNFYFPAGFEAFFMGSAVPAGGDALPPEDFPPSPMSLLKRLSEDCGGMPPTSERSTRPNPDAIAEPMVFTAASAPGYWYEGARWSVLADATSTGGSYCAFEVDLPAGATLGLHVRDVTDEACYLLEGEAEMLMDDQAAPMATRSLSYAPRGTVTASRAGASGARLLVVHTSPGFERPLAAAGVPTTGDGAPQDASPRIDPKRLRDLHADIGLRLLKSLSWPAGSTEVSSDAMAMAPSAQGAGADAGRIVSRGLVSDPRHVLRP